MRPSKRENKINEKLNGVLVKNGLDAVTQSERDGNAAIDIEVDLGGIRIAIECEKYDSNKKAQAVKDAVSRFSPVIMVSVALAVVYPETCKTEDDFGDETVLTYAVVTNENAIKYGKDHKKHADSIKWNQCKAAKLHVIVKELPRNMGDADSMAANLKARLTNAIYTLSVQQRRKLGKSISLTYPTEMNATKLEKAENAAAKRALLVVASAALFHARLDEYIDDLKRPPKVKSWPPRSPQACNSDPNPKTSLSKSWEIILEYDYKPIFEAAIHVLNASNDPTFINAIRDMVMWALETVGQIGGLRHDLLGRLFHAVLDTARNDGSYYTTTPAATLLVHLALRDASDLPKDPTKMRVLDPACGTGTLLMAAGERIRSMSDDITGNALIENILHGVDINMTATHMAATTLGLLSPTTKFSKMNISVAAFGEVDGVGRAGSLEMYDDEGLLPTMDWFTGPSAQVDTGKTIHIGKHSTDLVIMNPPFTRNAIRHDQLGRGAEKKVKQREESIFSKADYLLNDQPGKDMDNSAKKNKETMHTKNGGLLNNQSGDAKNRSKKPKIPTQKVKNLMYSSGPMFMVLAEHLQKTKGTLAVVLPAVVATSLSNRQLRLFVAKKYHIDTIIMPHDPKRFRFSENTNIGEILIVMRRTGNNKDTLIINLAENPGTVPEAMALADKINTDEEGTDYSKVMWPRSLIEKGDWSGVLFFSQFLTDRFVDIRDGNMFKESACLIDVADTGQPPQGVRGIFTASDKSDKYARYARYDHKTDEVVSLHATANKYLIARKGKGEQADKVWENGAWLHVVERVQPNTTKVFAVKTDDKSVGTSWHTIKPKNSAEEQSSENMVEKWSDDMVEKWSEAMVVYLNSTLGVVSLLGVRIPRKPLYPRYGVDSVRSIPVPKLDKTRIMRLARLYKKYKNDNLGLLQNPNEMRVAIDRAVCRILGADIGLVSQMRTELSREPMITGRRYNEAPLDSYAK